MAIKSQLIIYSKLWCRLSFQNISKIRAFLIFWLARSLDNFILTLISGVLGFFFFLPFYLPLHSILYKVERAVLFGIKLRFSHFVKSLMTVVLLKIWSKICLLCLKLFGISSSELSNIISDYSTTIFKHTCLFGVSWIYQQDSPLNPFISFCLSTCTLLLASHIC